MNRGTVLFLVAVVIALATGHLLRDTPGYVVRQPDGSYEGDINHYVYWTRVVTLGGMQSAYSGIWPETYAVYPPVTLYPYWVVGSLYRAIEDPTFDADRAQDSLWLHEAIKFVALGWHLLTGVSILAVLGRMLGHSSSLPGLAAALYVANPAALFDVAHWAQPDGAHALFSVLAVGLLGFGAVPSAWAAMTLAALSKPQAWVLLPLLLVGSVRVGRPVLLGRALLAAGGVALVVAAPFIISGRATELLGLPSTIASVMPVVSADAHNVWRLVGEARGHDPILLLDRNRFLGPLTYRELAAVLVVGVVVFCAWLYCTGRASLPEAAALTVLGWFDFTTQAHENHLFFALPLLALAWPARRSLVWIYGLLSVTVLLNMLLHDQLVLESLGARLDDPLIETLRLGNAVANVACCLGWGVMAAARRPRQMHSGMGALAFRYSEAGRSF